MKKLFAFLLSLTLLAATAVPLFAQAQSKAERKKNARARFEEMDTNNDGKVSKSEWKGRPRAFDRLDADHDGYVTRDELKAGRKKGKK